MKDSLISVIVPTRNSAKFLEDCLKSILNQNYENLEIIVVDNSSTDETKEIVNNFSKIKDLGSKINLYNKGPERSAQRNYGASKAKGEYLLFVDSDMELSSQVVEDCVQQVEDYKISKVNKELGGIIIPEESFGEGFWAKCKALERSYYVGVDWMEAARFFSKEIFNEFNGFDENLTSGEDWDLNQRVKQKYEILRIDSSIRHNEGNLSLLQLLKKKMYYGSKLGNYSSKKANNNDFVRQSSIINRYKLFFSNPKKLFSIPTVGAGMLLMKTMEFGAGAVGYLFKK